MSKENRPAKQTVFLNPVVLTALITVIGSIITTLIVTATDLLKARQLSPASSTSISAATATFPPPTATWSPIPPTEAPPTVTFTAPAPTDTPPTPVTPPLDCLERWQVISSDETLTAPGSSPECSIAHLPGLGISASSLGLLFGQNNFKKQGLFGIATPVPGEATLRFRVEMTVLTQGEFWIALSDTPTPEANALIFALQPQNGEVRYYLNQTSAPNGRIYWDQLSSQVNFGAAPPYVYDFKVTISGNKVSHEINLIDLPSQIVNLPKYLFLGYRNKSTLGSVTMQVKISNLAIEARR